jgi:hypothetical protein
MFAAYVIVTIVAIAANAFSGIAAILHVKPILPGMARAGVPESWLNPQDSGRGRPAARPHRRATDRHGGRHRPHPVLRLRHLHPRARKRLFAAVRPGERIPPASHSRAGAGPSSQASLRRRQNTSIHVPFTLIGTQTHGCSLYLKAGAVRQ